MVLLEGSQMAVVLTMLCVGPWNEVNDQMCAIIDICADRGVDTFFRMVPTTSKAIARAQLKAILQRRLGMAIIRERANARLEALAGVKYPHRLYFQNKGHLSRSDTARAWRPYKDMPAGSEILTAHNTRTGSAMG